MHGHDYRPESHAEPTADAVDRTASPPSPRAHLILRRETISSLRVTTSLRTGANGFFTPGCDTGFPDTSQPTNVVANARPRP